MQKYDELERDAKKWIAGLQGDSFLIDDAVEALAGSGKFEKEEDRTRFETRLRNILDTFDSLARPRSSDTFYLLDPFFEGTVFYCKPRPFELKEGILVTGCRFEAFKPEEVFADELEIRTPSGDRAEVRSFSCSCGTVSDLYFLLGPALTIDLFSAESQENYEALRSSNGLRDNVPLNLNVFDFSEFYRQSGFRNGDLIRFEIVSYMRGIFKVSHVSLANAPSRTDVDKWIECFEKGLTRVFSDFKDSLEIPAQLMMAYVTAADSGCDVRHLPAPPIDQYHTMMQEISFNRNGIEWTLVPMEDDPEPVIEEETGKHECSCGHDHGKKDENLEPEDFSVSQGRLDSLEGILKQTHATVNEVELNALMFSTLANGSDDFEEFSRTNGDLIKVRFVDEAQEAAFLNFIEDRWEDTVEHYGYNLDSLKAPLRERLLEMIRRRADLLPQLKDRKDLSEKMESVRRSIDDTLAFLDRDAVLEDGPEFEDLELRVGDIEDEFDLVADQLED